MNDAKTIRSRSLYSFWQARQIALCMLCAILALGLPACFSFYPDEPTPVNVSHTAGQLNGLSLLWSRDDAYLYGRNEILDASVGMGCLIGDLGKPLQYTQIVCFHDETGEMAWKEGKSGDRLLAATPTGVVVADDGHVLNHLSKYDLQNGDLIWRKKFGYSLDSIGLTFFNNQVQLITTKPDRLVIWDIDGNVLKVIPSSSVTEAFLSIAGVTFTHTIGIEARRADTNAILWEYPDTGMAFYPMATQDKLFGRSDGYSGTAYALDRNTGKLLWKIRDTVNSSNLAYSPEKHRVYALRNGGDLLAIDENTGNITVVAKFSSPLFLSVMNGEGKAYELAYDQEQHILLIALGDGHQLFAFREE